MADERRFHDWEIAAATMAKIHNVHATKREHLISDWAELHPLLVREGGGRSGSQQVTGDFNRGMYEALRQLEERERNQ
jgi:hypothetical protein